MFVEFTIFHGGQKMLLNSNSIQTVRKDSEVSTLISTYDDSFRVTESYDEVKKKLNAGNDKNICGFLSEEKTFKTDFT